MEMHGRLGLARGSRGKSEQRDIVPAGPDGIEPHRLVQRYPIELGVMVGSAVEIHHLLQKPAGLRAGNQLIGDAAVGQRQRYLGLVDNLAEFTGAQHRHGVDDDGAGLGGRQPGCDQGRVVSRADQDPAAGLDAIILDQRMGQPVRPVRQFLVGALASIADQGDAIAHAFLDNAIGQLDRRVEIFRVLKLGPVKQQFRPLIRRRQIAPGEIIDMA